MEDFEQVYAGLNTAQKQAVDAVEGPVLVVAGPGTGKTQLLSARVAQILRVTDALPQNILCLTFTETGASNMRERLTRFIGSDAYDVAISTYHTFGSDIIRRYPEYFTETRLEQPVDELGKRQLLSSIVDRLPYRNPLKQTRHHLGDLIATVSEVKRGLLSPDDLRGIAADNLDAIRHASPDIGAALQAFTSRMPGKLNVAEPAFNAVLQALRSASQKAEPVAPFLGLAQLAAEQLEQALAGTETAGSTKPLTAWKNKWLAKDDANNFVLAGRLEAERMTALAEVLEAYERLLAERGLYDFDDMILRTIKALENRPELRYSLQEQYQYILLDEFQDTNAAQLRIVELLTDNPVNEGRPNVLAVGDDDQAIYAFQGAQYSNMLDFFNMYTDVLVVNLSENYRSTGPILETARHLAEQITDSLVSTLPKLTKQLVAAGKNAKAHTSLSHVEYVSDVSERAGVAERIAELMKEGVKPEEIAVLAPKHRYLEALVPYLQDHDIPVSYEHRENILEAPAIRQLLTMSRLTLALHDRDLTLADSLWPEVLSYEFWGHAVADIWQLSWQAADGHDPWAKLLLDSDRFRGCALLFAALASQATTDPLEIMLDRLIGTEEVQTGDPEQPTIRSPFRDYYTDRSTEDVTLYQVATELAVLRARLREHESQAGDQLTLPSLIDFVDQYQAADQKLINTSPYHQAADAVQLMTVFRAKGLEFEHVFILHAQDNVWGGSAHELGNKLTLPANLAPIRHAGATEDERLRIFFVAASRAKQGLHLTSHRATYAGKQLSRLKYLDEIETENGEVISRVLPAPYNKVRTDGLEAPALSAMEHDWRTRHLCPDAGLKELLKERLANYRLSPTHLTTFLDLEHAGPQSFLLETLLRFPRAPSTDIAFGNAMHGVLEWIQQQVNAEGSVPSQTAIERRFRDILTRQRIYGEAYALQEARGLDALRAIVTSPELRFMPGNRPEYTFRQEGVVSGPAVLNGKVDLLEIHKETKTICIVDYKTGSFGTDPAKLHRYTLQLYGYKMLVNGSHSFGGYRVDTAKLVFVDPAMNGGKIVVKPIRFEAAELQRVQKLSEIVWQHIRDLNIPDISSYAPTFAAIRQFEQDLLDGKI
ncbi:MAG TPA: ATP-dependent DNA helicase [Candidatus Saccharimonadales bacterium]|nr:ATP-dependent DNA helicase [Candidatus Saccharimonadales bacterium]